MPLGQSPVNASVHDFNEVPTSLLWEVQASLNEAAGLAGNCRADAQLKHLEDTFHRTKWKLRICKTMRASMVDLAGTGWRLVRLWHRPRPTNGPLVIHTFFISSY